jgi:hypothetical protein
MVFDCLKYFCCCRMNSQQLSNIGPELTIFKIWLELSLRIIVVVETIRKNSLIVCSRKIVIIRASLG